MIIGITGTNGAGKGTIVKFLKEKGFNHFSARTFINEEIVKRNLSINRDNMILVANNLRKNHSPSFIAESLFRLAEKKEGNSVIESLRTPGEINKLKEEKDFLMFAVNANQKIRFQRIKQRNDSQSDNIDFAKFVEQEQLEMTSTDPNKQNLSKCIRMSDFVFENDDSIDELKKQIEVVLNDQSKN